MTVTNPAQTNTLAELSGGKSARLHYLDWLLVLAVLGVVLFHTIVPFDALVPWGIKNAERSALATLFSVFFTPWGMPFFFFMAGVTSWFSLRRCTPGRYVRERVTQLLVRRISPVRAFFGMKPHKA